MLKELRPKLRTLTEPSIDAQWAAVKSFYERYYEIKFKGRPKKQNIRFMYDAMIRMQASFAEAVHQGRINLAKLAAFDPSTSRHWRVR